MKWIVLALVLMVGTSHAQVFKPRGKGPLLKKVDLKTGEPTAKAEAAAVKAAPQVAAKAPVEHAVKAKPAVSAKKKTVKKKHRKHDDDDDVKVSDDDDDVKVSDD
jgi:hypothetical protein